MNQNSGILDDIYQVILSRAAEAPEKSYTASLMNKGLDTVLKKVGEEATELVIAGKGGSHREIICETADLLFHTLVLLGYHKVSPEQVYEELRRRFGTSGIEEKKSRQT